MPLKPWYKVITPREDLREGKPLDAAEFAVRLDQVREGIAPDDYKNPERFFDRTYLTKNLTGLAAEVVRRLSGEKTETSAVFNMATQFGGGKTHALTLLYHLVNNGREAEKWHGVNHILDQAGVATVPKAKIAVFVGTEFDSITGRGGSDGEPLRMTPWGEVAYQLAGKKGFDVVAEHDKQGTAPAGDVIRKFIPKDTPCLILMDEIMNYVSRNRKSDLAAQLYNFIQNVCEEARARNNLVLAVSVPASELEMNPGDQMDYERLKKLLDRLGKAVLIAAESETSEIIRRRLFEWKGIPDDAQKTITEFADWTIEHRLQIPQWFPIDQARDAFAATYPFHPLTISVFERKWQSLPRFHKTRGVLRMLALWVSKAYIDGYKGDHRDPLIGLGTAPLENPTFRTAVFEQLGASNLEGAGQQTSAENPTLTQSDRTKKRQRRSRKHGCIARRPPRFSLNQMAGRPRMRRQSRKSGLPWQNRTLTLEMLKQSWKRYPQAAISSA
jgi:predicted AAA+ superfamily ATPase